MLIKHPNCACTTDDECLMHDYELQKSVKKMHEELSETRQLDATIAALRVEVERWRNAFVDARDDRNVATDRIKALEEEVDRLREAHNRLVIKYDELHDERHKEARRADGLSADLSRYREAVEWAINHFMIPEMVKDELRRKAGRE